ncbi:hypothetical protein Hamer_G020137 [Homarus americanus]|uniref:Uncharacterized protein n=1 Tax=Homarus americanus TaxID=6706 RepID=A0A8J5N5H0_HOMAM|nr:hypothetical protein Hamer_G020137 [Homarus americanus]
MRGGVQSKVSRGCRRDDIDEGR